MMRLYRRILGSFILAPALGLVLTASALAASSFTYTLSGVEIAATSTVGTFVGVGTTADDTGAWSASINHSVLTGGTATINGGTFAYTGIVRHIAGTFTGGSLTQTSGSSGASPCTNQTYSVTGSLTLTAPGSGTGTFNAVLTHYRLRLFGQCIVYAATVKGGATFSF
jgi:hypothetical protein